MLTRHPSNTKANVEKDEISIIETIMTAKDKSTGSDKPTSVIEERVKAAAKLEGVSTDKILARNMKITIATNNTNVTTTNVSRNNADRLSKESGIGSSVSSSFDERDDEIDNSNNEPFTSSSSQSTTNTSLSIETKVSPRATQILDDLDDTKLANDNKKSLGIITEEEESYNNNLNHYRSRNHYNNDNSFFKKHQNRITFSDNLDSNSEVTESSAFNDTESSTSGGDPDSPSLLNNISIPINNSSKIELEKKKNFKRKNSGRSIFSVLSSSSLRSSSSSSLQRGSLSDPEDTSPNHHHQRVATPGSPSKSGRSGFSSLSIRRRRSKPTLSVAISNDSNDNNNKMISSGLLTSGSPENLENLSKAGKILGLTASEEKILLAKKPRDTTTSSDERILSPTSTKYSKSNSGKANKILGYNDNKPILNKSSKANRILGLDDDELNRRSSSMYVDKVASEFRGGSIGGLVSPITVASIGKDIICKGFLTKYTNTNFVLSKSWKRRYFILAKNTLYCFKSSDSASQLLDQFELTADSVVCVSDSFSGKSWVLQVSKSNQKSWYIQADNVDDMKVWLTELKSIVLKPLHPNLTGLLPNDDGDDDEDYDYDNHKINAMHQRTFSSPSKLVDPPKLSLVKPSPSIDDNSADPYSLPPPPRPFMMTSLPPPPRPRSAPSSPSCPPSPTTSLSPPPRPMSPYHHIPADVEELSNGSINNDDLEPRSSSPVETLSPPRARSGDSTQSHQHNNSISSTFSTNSLTSFSKNKKTKQRSNSVNSSLSINTTFIQQSSPHQSPLSPSAINNSPRKSTSSHRESIPIMMPSWGLITASSTSMLNPVNNSISLSPPSRLSPYFSLHNGQQKSTHLPNPHKSPEGPKPPARNNVQISSINPDRYLTRSPPPSIPLPQPPPRPINTLTSASRIASSNSSRNHTIPPSIPSHPIPPPLPSHPIPPPLLSHPTPPIPPPRRPSADGRTGGKGANSITTNLPPTQNMKPLHERAMTLPVNLPSRSPPHTRLPTRSKSPPPSRKNVASMVYSSNPSRYQTMSLHLPSYVAIAPPTRPPNVPLPPVPTQSFSPSSSSCTSIITPSVTKDTTSSKTQNIILPSTIIPTEFPDDDDLDPDYADELAASRIHSQKTLSTNGLSNTTYFSVISNADNNSSLTNYHQQLPASGLTFVMVEETLGDGELVLDLQDVSKNHPHIIRSRSTNNIYDLIQNDNKEKNISEKHFSNTTLKEMESSNEKEKENLKEKKQELVKGLESKLVKNNLNSEKNEKDNTNFTKRSINEQVIEIVNNNDKNNISNIPFSKVSI